MASIARPQSDIHVSPVAYFQQALVSQQTTESMKSFALPSAFPLLATKSISSESLQFSSQSPKTKHTAQEQFLFKRIHDIIEESTASNSDNTHASAPQTCSARLANVSSAALENFAQYLNMRLAKNESLLSEVYSESEKKGMNPSSILTHHEQSTYHNTKSVSEEHSFDYNNHSQQRSYCNNGMRFESSTTLLATYPMQTI